MNENHLSKPFCFGNLSTKINYRYSSLVFIYMSIHIQLRQMPLTTFSGTSPILEPIKNILSDFLYCYNNKSKTISNLPIKNIYTELLNII